MKSELIKQLRGMRDSFVERSMYYEAAICREAADCIENLNYDASPSSPPPPQTESEKDECREAYDHYSLKKQVFYEDWRACWMLACSSKEKKQ